MRIRFTESYIGDNPAGVKGNYRKDQCVACPKDWGLSIVKKGKAVEMGSEEYLKESIEETFEGSIEETFEEPIKE